MLHDLATTVRRHSPRGALALASVVAFGSSPSLAASVHVWRVGTYRGIPGQFQTIQAAVNAARPGDWILVAPGDYHENGSTDPGLPAGVLIRTPGIHLRGLDRNLVIVDGSNGSAARATATGSLGPSAATSHGSTTAAIGGIGSIAGVLATAAILPDREVSALPRPLTRRPRRPHPIRRGERAWDH